MNSRECFENEAELYLYLDDEIAKARGAALNAHIVVCGQCARKLLIWKQLKGIMRCSFSDTKAPIYMKERINFLIGASNGHGNSVLLKKSNILQSSEYPPVEEILSDKSIMGLPLSVPRNSQDEQVGRRIQKPDSH